MCSSGNPLKSNESPYLPLKAEVRRVEKVSPRERLFEVRPTWLEKGERLEFAPGQFFMVGLPGYGEAPISISSGDGKVFELCIRAVGNVTNAAHRLTEGEHIWMRGPFGRGFDTRALEGKDLLFIAGGIGMVPMRSLVKEVLKDPSRYGRLTLLYGAREPDELLFLDDMGRWKLKGVDARITIDKPHQDWDGKVGVITTLIPEVDVDPENTVAVIIGPPVMYKFVILSLDKKNITHENVLVSLERKMKCGLGKCGHCQINNYYGCQDGPVFRLSELKGLHEAF